MAWKGACNNCMDVLLEPDTLLARWQLLAVVDSLQSRIRSNDKRLLEWSKAATIWLYMISSWM